jgi:RNA polymerase sigma factor (sigma-70 family)
LQPYFHTPHDAYLALLAGDEKALEYFFNLYYSKMVYYSFSIVENWQTGEEIASESFLKLWNKKEKLTEWQMVYPLLYHIAHNTSVDWLRKEKAMAKKKKQWIHHSLPHEPAHLEKIIETNTYAALHRLLQLLPPKKALVMKMAILENKTNEEIAKELGLSVYTIRNQKAAAVQLLKKYSPTLNRLLAFVLTLSFFL